MNSFHRYQLIFIVNASVIKFMTVYEVIVKTVLYTKVLKSCYEIICIRYLNLFQKSIKLNCTKKNEKNDSQISRSTRYASQTSRSTQLQLLGSIVAHLDSVKQILFDKIKMRVTNYLKIKTQHKCFIFSHFTKRYSLISAK